MKRNILLNPGPATTTDSVKWAQVVPDICPREKEFQDLIIGIQRDLLRVVHAEETHECVLFGGSGTAAMDACINSVVPPGASILVIANGAYGERLIKIAQSYQIDVVPVRYDLRIENLESIDRLIKKNPKIKSVAMIHHETTTGILNPVADIVSIAKANGCSMIVDAISSYAGIPVSLQKLDVDFLMSTSNKCIQGMAGLAFVLCKRASLEAIQGYPSRSYYLNLFQQYHFFKTTKQMQFTPPVQVAYALRRAIDEYFQEGAEARYNRYTENWRVLRQGLLGLGFQLLLDENEESHILTSILEPKNKTYDFSALHDALYEKGFTIYPGKIASRNTFRIATMGAIFPEDIQNFLSELKRVMTNQRLLPLEY